jgi:RNA polymerase sigma-70 factor (ECF subfamily)
MRRHTLVEGLIGGTTSGRRAPGTGNVPDASLAQPAVAASAREVGRVRHWRPNTRLSTAGRNASGRSQKPRLRGRLARWYLAANSTNDGQGIEDRGEHYSGAVLGREALAYAASLYNVAYYLARNAADAEDLVQQTYVRAMRAANQFAPGTHLKAWLFCILRNTFFSLHRRQRYSVLIGGLAAFARTMPERAHQEWLQDDLELDRLRRVVREDIERALITLSEPARTVILLDLEGLTEAEIAQIAGCAVGTVTSRLARARATLRHQLRDYAK